MNKKPKNKVKDSGIGFRCTKKEKEQLVKMAEKENMKIGDYLIQSARNQSPGKQLAKLMPDVIKRMDDINTLIRMIEGSSDRELKRNCHRILEKWGEENGKNT